jgi:hypothetical protein
LPRISGSRDSVAADTISATRTAASRSLTGTPPTFAASAAACSSFRAHTMTRSMSRTARCAATSIGAIRPAPTTSSVLLSLRAR